jgi:ParB-like chromosome segregation protein Spo0J
MLARTSRNPIIVAQEWQQALQNGAGSSAADLARKLGISRARVTQVLHLLKLAPDVLNAIAALGDPLPSRAITERMLRSIVHHSAEEQRQELRRLLTTAGQNVGAPFDISERTL